MKTSVLMICFLITGAKNIQAQEAATAGGGEASGSGGTASYSVGQAVYTAAGSSSGSVSQGVQQAYTITVTKGNTTPGITLQASVYPNPTLSFINLKVENTPLENLSIQLVDAQGKLLMHQKISTAETSFNMETFAAGNYFLKVIHSNSELKTFKICKN